MARIQLVMAMTLDGFLPEELARTVVELLQRLFFYHMVDEAVIYLLPITVNKGIHIMKHVSPCQRLLYKAKQYPGYLHDDISEM